MPNIIHAANINVNASVDIVMTLFAPGGSLVVSSGSVCFVAFVTIKPPLR